MNAHQVVTALVLVMAAGACSSGSDNPAKSAPTRAAVAYGTARRDGRAFDARWIGAVVRRDHLITPCQAELPRIRNGNFGVTVYGAAQAGCGGPGTSVRFWTYGARQLFNDRWVPWSRLARPLALRFSTAGPAAPVPARTEISGRAFDQRGRPVPVGTVIEARVDSTRCGVASVRAGGGFRGYIMNIVGPDSIPECRDGATVSFLVGGTPARETATNGRSVRGLFRLTAATPA